MNSLESDSSEIVDKVCFLHRIQGQVDGKGLIGHGLPEYGLLFAGTIEGVNTFLVADSFHVCLEQDLHGGQIVQFALERRAARVSNEESHEVSPLGDSSLKHEILDPKSPPALPTPKWRAGQTNTQSEAQISERCFWDFDLQI